MEISPGFKQQHFLIGLVLSELYAIFEVPNGGLHVKAVNIIRNLLSWHDSDSRYALKEARQRLAHLYLPLVGIIMDSLPQLYEFVRGWWIQLSNFSCKSEFFSHPSIIRCIDLLIFIDWFFDSSIDWSIDWLCIDIL